MRPCYGTRNPSRINDTSLDGTDTTLVSKGQQRAEKCRTAATYKGRAPVKRPGPICYAIFFFLTTYAAAIKIATAAAV